MEDSYTGLLNRARELKLSRDGKDDDNGDEKRDDKPSGSVATDTERGCFICGAIGASGYRATCCGGHICEDCLKLYDEGKYDHIFQVGKEGQPVCAFCPKDITNPAALQPWVPAQHLPALRPAGEGHAAPDSDAWNFKLHHRCGHEIVVAGWEECDILSGECPKCHARSVSLTGTTAGHSYELRDLLRQLAGFHPRASVRAFAALATTFPNAWRALRLTSLLDAIAKGEQPDLSLWNQEAVSFLRQNAAKILAQL